MEDRFDVKILGRVVGTAIGWDEMDVGVMFIYGFESNGKTTLENGDLNVDYINGKFEYFNEAGQVEFTQSIIGVMSTMTP